MAKPAVKVRFYRFQNRLKKKAGGAGAKGVGAIAPEVLLRAQQALDRVAEDYPDWVSKLIRNLYEEHAHCLETTERRRGYFGNIHRIAHDMKGQGGTFGYDLISTFSESLCDVTSRTAGTSDSHVEIVKAHIDAMNAVIKERVKGDGGEVGQAIAKSLQDAIGKFENRKH
ncbi:MAG: hypothetical protein ACE5EM_00105 [Sphingomonadales bacterium]